MGCLVGARGGCGATQEDHAHVQSRRRAGRGRHNAYGAVANAPSFRDNGVMSGRKQYAALPFIILVDSIEVCLITSKE
ncbi:MAG TPA: hypothetical protein VGA50_12610, partial [Kiloniellales bacterium]